MNQGENVVSLEAYRQKKQSEAAQTKLLRERERAIADLDKRLGLMRNIGIGFIEQGRGFALEIIPKGYTGIKSEYEHPRN